MQGRASNFEEVHADFAGRLRRAKFVAVDMEMTGTDLRHEPDSPSESAEDRVAKYCRIAEQHAAIQIGFTIVSEENECASYNFFALPSNQFCCQTSALRFNVDHGVDLNAWVREGVPVLSREEEEKEAQLDRRAGHGGSCRHDVGLLHLWKALCAADVPLVVHSPKDVFFLLAAFERPRLSQMAPHQLSDMVRRCFAGGVYDVAHLFDSIGGFSRRRLSDFGRDARRKAEELRIGALAWSRETQAAYGDRASEHEAGYDSLLTAQLFHDLQAMAPETVREGKNRLYLYQSSEFLDFSQEWPSYMVGRSVAALGGSGQDQPEAAARGPAGAAAAPQRLLAAAGLEDAEPRGEEAVDCEALPLRPPAGCKGGPDSASSRGSGRAKAAFRWNSEAAPFHPTATATTTALGGSLPPLLREARPPRTPSSSSSCSCPGTPLPWTPGSSGAVSSSLSGAARVDADEEAAAPGVGQNIIPGAAYAAGQQLDSALLGRAVESLKLCAAKTATTCGSGEEDDEARANRLLEGLLDLVTDGGGCPARSPPGSHLASGSPAAAAAAAAAPPRPAAYQ